MVKNSSNIDKYIKVACGWERKYSLALDERDIALKEKEDIKQAFDSVSKTTEEAIDFIKELKLKNKKLLRYNNILLVIVLSFIWRFLYANLF